MGTLAFTFWILLFCFAVNGYVKQKILLKKFMQCFGENDLPILLKDFEVSQKSKGQYFLSGIFDIKQDLPDGWKYKMEVYKCKDIHNIDSCEIYLDKLKTDDGCTILNQLIANFDEISSKIYPKITCPLKAGIYKMEDCPLNGYIDNVFTYASSASVAMKIEGFHNEVKLFCTDARFDITNRKMNNTK